MYAIVTKVLPCTATKPVRIRVTCGPNNKVRFYCEPVDSEDRHVYGLHRWAEDERAAGRQIPELWLHWAWLDNTTKVWTTTRSEAVKI